MPHRTRRIVGCASAALVAKRSCTRVKWVEPNRVGGLVQPLLPIKSPAKAGLFIGRTRRIRTADLYHVKVAL